MKKRVALIIYIAVFLLICLAPSLGLLFGGPGESTENRTLAAAPQLKTEEGWNERFLNDAGAYFEDHFAFRNQWVTGYALLTGKLFGVSAQSSVIVGKNNWLYYMDSLGDYQGSEQMTERELFIAAHTLAMMQTYAEEQGVDFVFTVAPNKNSLYGGNMPYYYQYYRTEEKNLTRIQKYLESEGVHYVDLYGALDSQDDVLYHARDSHWNNRGAALAADEILSALGQDHADYRNRSYQSSCDYEGDLDAMLYPAAVTPEKEFYYDPMPKFDYVEEVESNFAPKIDTLSKSGVGSLVMYRDSFGNALLPFMAEAFAEAHFSRAVPYQMSDLFEYEADTLVVERAERFLPELASNAPAMPAPIVSDEELWELEFDADIADLSVEEQGDYTLVTGRVPEDAVETQSRIFVRVNDLLTYEAFSVIQDDGAESFQLTLLTELLETEGMDNSFEICIQ